MTYHPRFTAGGIFSPASVQLSVAQLFGQIEQAHGEASAQGTSPERSSGRELRLAHARLARLFPDESFAPGCIAADRRTAISLLAVFIGLMAVIGVRSIS